METLQEQARKVLDRYGKEIRQIRLRRAAKLQADIQAHGRSYVYVVEATGLDRYKVGITCEPRQRLLELQTGCPAHLKLLAAVYVGNPRQWEKEIHGRLAPYHVVGEWFALSRERLSQLLEGMNILDAKHGLKYGHDAQTQRKMYRGHQR